MNIVVEEQEMKEYKLHSKTKQRENRTTSHPRLQ